MKAKRSTRAYIFTRARAACVRETAVAIIRREDRLMENGSRDHFRDPPRIFKLMDDRVYTLDGAVGENRRTGKSRRSIARLSHAFLSSVLHRNCLPYQFYRNHVAIVDTWSSTPDARVTPNERISRDVFSRNISIGKEIVDPSLCEREHRLYLFSRERMGVRTAREAFARAIEAGPLC